MYKNLQLASTKSKSININLILHLRKRNLGDQYLKLKSYLNELGKKIIEVSVEGWRAMTNRRNLGELRCMETPIKESREGVREPPCTDNFFFSFSNFHSIFTLQMLEDYWRRKLKKKRLVVLKRRVLDGAKKGLRDHLFVYGVRFFLHSVQNTTVRRNKNNLPD